MATPISDCEVRDPRIRRTRQLLKDSLGKIMQTKAFDEISVQDIAEAATVNRATFYDHYTDKYALLESTIAGGFHQLLHLRQVNFDGSCPSQASSIILATCDYLTQMHGDSTVCNRQSAFEPLADAAITAAIRRVLENGIPKAASGQEQPSLPSNGMIAAAVSSAIYGSVKQWFFTPDHPPSEQVVPAILELVLPMLQQATMQLPNAVPAL